MAEIEPVSNWRRFANRQARRVKPLLPVLGWLFVASTFYAFVGASVFPGWWKRFLLSGGWLDPRYWAVAFSYFGDALRTGHPVGLVTVALSAIVAGWIIFTLGRVGAPRVIASVAPPHRWVLLVTIVVFGLTLIGLAVYPEQYKTPDELHAELQLKLKLSEKENARSIFSYFLPTAPESGFFLYLDGPKLARTYNVLQKDLALALATTTQERQGERRAQVTLKTVSGEAVDRKRVENTVQMVPQAPTPERQAQWLIHTYNELDLALEIPTFYAGDPESYEARSAREALNERGVALTGQQLDALREGDAKVLAKELSKPNAPMLYAGKLLLLADGESFRVTIKTGGGAEVTASGSGTLRDLDDSMHACARKKEGCTVDGKILAIVWRTQRTGTTINLDFVPLAMW
jgi:hypothetical protein